MSYQSHNARKTRVWRFGLSRFNIQVQRLPADVLQPAASCIDGEHGKKGLANDAMKVYIYSLLSLLVSWS